MVGRWDGRSGRGGGLKFTKIGIFRKKCWILFSLFLYFDIQVQNSKICNKYYKVKITKGKGHELPSSKLVLAPACSVRQADLRSRVDRPPSSSWLPPGRRSKLILDRCEEVLPASVCRWFRGPQVECRGSRAGVLIIMIWHCNTFLWR